jgi:hypothetical protein
MSKKLNRACIVAINGSASSIRFALNQVGEAMGQQLDGKVGRRDHQVVKKIFGARHCHEGNRLA